MLAQETIKNKCQPKFTGCNDGVVKTTMQVPEKYVKYVQS